LRLGLFLLGESLSDKNYHTGNRLEIAYSTRRLTLDGDTLADFIIRNERASGLEERRLVRGLTGK